ncbi:MAG: hypothetical protein GY953_05625, partial [bacterium]|nr:hypothetical protein [bacterium]
MQCPTRTGDSVEMLVAHAAGQLEGERAALVERHLEECPGCRELFESQRSVWTALDEWEPEPVSADFDARLYRTIEARDQTSWWRQLFRPVLPFSMRPALPLAAACLMLVAALLVRMPPDPATSAVAG